MRMIFGVLVSVLFAGSAFAQSTPPPPIPPAVGGAQKLLGTVFSALEQKLIDRYFRTATPPSTKSRNDDDDDGYKKKSKSKGKNKDKKMPPGLAKRSSLPPGLQKRLEKHGALPPGLAKRDLPTKLKHQLPPARQGTERVIAGNDVVLIETATGVVLDILHDVVSGVLK